MNRSSDLEVAVLEAGLEASEAPWKSVGASTQDPYVETLLELHALYGWVRAEFPNLQITKGVMDLLVAYAPDSSPWVYAADFPTFESNLRFEGVRAAAELGRSGQLEAVLVSCSILSHGFDFCSTGSRALIDDYRYALPAVASYFSADGGVVQDFAALDVPPWFAEGQESPESIRANTLCRAINPSLSRSSFLELVGTSRHGAWTPAMLGNAARGSFVWLTLLGLGRDPNILTPDAASDAERALAYVVEVLAADDEWSPEEVEREVSTELEPLELALMVAGDFGAVLDAADPEAVNRRLDGWAHGPGWRSVDAWPDSLEQIRSALRHSSCFR